MTLIVFALIKGRHKGLPTLMLAAENLTGIGPHDLVRIDMAITQNP